jgi:hypothetical protein
MSSQVRERVSRVEARSAARIAGPFGLSPKEIVAAALSILFFVVVVVYYFTSLRPEQARLRVLEQRLREQEVIVSSDPGSGTSATVDTGKVALSTLEAFKTERLRPLSPGRIALQNDLNALIKKNSLQLTSSIESHVDTVKEEADLTAARRRKLEDMLSVFPRQNIHFTVFGQYPNLREFLSDLEHNKQFLVIKSINFTTQEDKSEGGGRAQRAASAGIMLTVELTAYFQP